MASLGFGYSPLLSGSEMNAAKGRRLHIDCGGMRLTNEGQVKFSGAGYFGQSPQGRLECALFDALNQPGTRVLDQLTVVPGTWLSAGDYYSLEAEDFSGRKWIANFVDAQASGAFGQPGSVARGSLNEIRTHGPYDHTNAWATVYFPGDFHLITTQGTETIVRKSGRELKSFSRDVWIIDTALGQLELTELDTGIDAVLNGTTPVIPDAFPYLLEETLALMVGRRVFWTFAEMCSAGEATIAVRSERTADKAPRLRPPIYHAHAGSGADASDLFAKYLKHVAAESQPDVFHPLSVATRKVLWASSGTVNDEALALSVEVESVVREFFSGAGKPDGMILAAVESMLVHLEHWKGPSDFRDRVKGAVSSFKGSNPRTGLRRLVELQVIDKQHLDAWERLRHPSAHGLGLDKAPREIAIDCDKVYQLLLFLIFELVGYTGRFTDYTRAGWPLVPRQKQP